MRGYSYIFYNKEGFFCYDHATEENSTHRIVLDHRGIVYGSRKFITDPWVDTSVWTIDGVFDAEKIQVKNLTADLIQNGILTLGSQNGQDGRLKLINDAGESITELNSQRTIYYLNNNGYVIIGKDIGLQVLSGDKDIQYGSELT